MQQTFLPLNRSILSRIMQDAWKMYLKYAEKEQMLDEDWSELLKDSKTIWDNSGRYELVGDMLNAYLSEIQRRFPG